MQASLTCSVFHFEGLSPVCVNFSNVLVAWSGPCDASEEVVSVVHLQPRNTATMLTSTELEQRS